MARHDTDVAPVDTGLAHVDAGHAQVAKRGAAAAGARKRGWVQAFLPAPQAGGNAPSPGPTVAVVPVAAPALAADAGATE